MLKGLSKGSDSTKFVFGLIIFVGTCICQVKSPVGVSAPFAAVVATIYGAFTWAQSKMDRATPGTPL